MGTAKADRALEWWLRIGAPLTVMVAATLPYLGALRQGFVWDDLALIGDDYRIRRLAGVLAAFGEDFFGSGSPYGYYRPLVTVSYAIDFFLGRLDPTVYHRTNLLLHAGCSWLLLVTLRRIGCSAALAFTVTVLWAVHPVHVESVAWIAGRTDLLATLLGFASLAIGLGPLHSGGGAPPSEAGWGRMLASSVCWLGALLSKEMAITLPAVKFLALWFGGRQRDARRGALADAFFLVGYVTVRLALVPPSPATLPLAATARSFASSIAKYLALFVAPIHLSAYRQNPYSDWTDPTWWIGAALSAAAVLFAAGIVGREWRLPRLGVAATGLLLLPLSNVVRVSAPLDMGFPMADRFLYLPSAAMAGLLAGVFGVLLRRAAGSGRVVEALGWSVWIGSLALTTVARVHAWRDNLSFFAQERAAAPGVPLVELNYGIALRAAGRDREAALVLAPLVDRSRPANSLREAAALALAGARAHAGDTNSARALLESLLPEARNRSAVLFNLGILDDAEGRIDEALSRYAAAAREDPWNVRAHRRTAVLLACLGDGDGARAALERWGEADPRNPARERLEKWVAERVELAHATGAPPRSPDAGSAWCLPPQLPPE